jgi:hypothetical protein
VLHAGFLPGVLSTLKIEEIYYSEARLNFAGLLDIIIPEYRTVYALFFTIHASALQFPIAHIYFVHMIIRNLFPFKFSFALDGSIIMANKRKVTHRFRVGTIF